MAAETHRQQQRYQRFSSLAKSPTLIPLQATAQCCENVSYAAAVLWRGASVYNGNHQAQQGFESY